MLYRHIHRSWWRHEIETFSALLGLCAGNSTVTVNSPLKGQWRGPYLICAWTNGRGHNRDADDFRLLINSYLGYIMPYVDDKQYYAGVGIITMTWWYDNDRGHDDRAIDADRTWFSSHDISIFSWWRYQMEAISALLALCATCEFPAQRPVMRSFDVFFDLRLNKRLSKTIGTPVI